MEAPRRHDASAHIFLDLLAHEGVTAMPVHLSFPRSRKSQVSISLLDDWDICGWILGYLWLDSRISVAGLWDICSWILGYLQWDPNGQLSLSDKCTNHFTAQFPQ